ncbi:hypothetical protein MJ579_28660 [Klebsiella pneumoniae]|nr:hypothetical protein MJ579_28660 [Klebsiella pneumoniae]
MIFQQAVEDPIVENDRVVGAVTQMASNSRQSGSADRRESSLTAKIHIGLDNQRRPRRRSAVYPAVSSSAELPRA